MTKSIPEKCWQYFLILSFRKRLNMTTKKKKATSKKGNPCWKNYRQLGMKKKDGKMVPNCVAKK